MTDLSRFALVAVTILAELLDTDPKEKQIMEAAHERAKTTDEDNTK